MSYSACSILDDEGSCAKICVHLSSQALKSSAVMELVLNIIKITNLVTWITFNIHGISNAHSKYIAIIYI